MIRRNLLDLNVLIALADPEHAHREQARRWFLSSGKNDWGICPLTEAGFIRITTHSALQAATLTVEQAIATLHELRAHPGCHYWPITEAESWASVTAPFASRISGHQQITDAYLLGLAIKNNGILVTFDRGLTYLAGPRFSRNLLVCRPATPQTIYAPTRVSLPVRESHCRSRTSYALSWSLRKARNASSLVQRSMVK